MKQLHLYRIGADPEWVFTKEKEWENLIVPAHMVISNNKPLAIQSFIGTDNHAATAEVRPAPSHNIKRQLLDIAAGMDAVGKYLDGSEKWRDLRIMAWPQVVNEPLGGHIHVSFFVDDPLLGWVRERNINYTNMIEPLNNDHPVGSPTSMQERDMLEKFAEAASNWQTPTPWVFGKTLNFLSHPLEVWVQPWHSRMERNSKYGKHMKDLVRQGVSTKPMIPKYGPFTYCHYEYRLPSTWLQHPYVAYVYFAVAKLTMLNFDKFAEMSRGSHEVHDISEEPQNDKFKALFFKRLDAVRKKGLKITNDIKDLDVALEAVDKNRKTWFDPAGGVNVEYWRELL